MLDILIRIILMRGIHNWQIVKVRSRLVLMKKILHNGIKQIDDPNPVLVLQCKNYSIFAYIEKLLNYSPAAKNSHLTNVLWYSYAPRESDTLSKRNSGFKSCINYTINAKIVDMIRHLHCDIFNQKRSLIHGMEMRLRLVRLRDFSCFIDSAGT